ncbi:unnamed protein product [Musa acuminata subsp. malaccensis]|uniref:(wild Malaysian banana) hypothetical protein n=1 Tax=Musa acuminata subsp. malaccensis TaxID=214687 RepID=A0A804LBE2_MUSAM|nr:unnamed protein product [Musa acuminata subsp. malaccensis]
MLSNGCNSIEHAGGDELIHRAQAHREQGRRAGLSKKVKELSLLCGAELALIVFSPACNPFSFDHPSVHSVIGCFLSSRAVSPPSTHCRHLLLQTVR